MKSFSFNGPGGEVRVKEPLAVRLVESTGILALITFLFILVGGYFIYNGHEGFHGHLLSPAHRKLEKNCEACHTPFRGVTDANCTSKDCHPRTMTDTIHNTLERTCDKCHTEHTDGAFLPEVVTGQGCVECHDRLKQDPKSIFFPAKWDQRTVTNVPRTVFRHRLHQYPPHYKCWQCHCTGKGTLNLKMDQLFVMESCMKCHEQKDCKTCHGYHQKREPRPRSTTCVKQEFVQELQFKTLECTPYKGREPGFNEMKVCETGESAAYQPGPAVGGTAASIPAAGSTASAGGLPPPSGGLPPPGPPPTP